MMTWVDSQLESFSQMRFAASPGRSPSSSMTWAGFSVTIHELGASTWTAPITPMSSSSSSRAARASAKMRSWSAIRTLIAMIVHLSCSDPVQGPALRPGAVDGKPAAGDSGGLDSAVRAQLGEHAPDMAPQGTRRDLHLAGHLPSALARHDPSQHLFFAWRELPEHILLRGRPRATVCLARRSWIEGHPAGADHLESTRERF